MWCRCWTSLRENGLLLGAVAVLGAIGTLDQGTAGRLGCSLAPGMPGAMVGVPGAAVGAAPGMPGAVMGVPYLKGRAAQLSEGSCRV